MARGRPHVSAYEMVTPRQAGMFFTTGKVTARYTVHLGKGKSVDCVRVHSFPGHAVFHFSVAEFHRIFKTWKRSVSKG